MHNGREQRSFGERSALRRGSREWAGHFFVSACATAPTDATCTATSADQHSGGRPRLLWRLQEVHRGRFQWGEWLHLGGRHLCCSGRVAGTLIADSHVNLTRHLLCTLPHSHSHTFPTSACILLLPNPSHVFPMLRLSNPSCAIEALFSMLTLAVSPLTALTPLPGLGGARSVQLEPMWTPAAGAPRLYRATP